MSSSPWYSKLILPTLAGVSLLTFLLLETTRLPFAPRAVMGQPVDPVEKPSPDRLSPNPCVSNSPALPIDRLLNRGFQAVNWMATAKLQPQSLWQEVGEGLLPYLSANPWPQLHDRAKLSRIPVIMYHDILPNKQVFFDVTPAELETDFQFIAAQGLTPISLDQLVAHLSFDIPLPEKPIVLTFDDGYAGHYQFAYPLLQRFDYPAVFSVFTAKVEGQVVGRSTLTWAQIQEMAANPLITIAAHSVTHPPSLIPLDDATLQREVRDSKQLLESQIGRPIRYFTYPEGHYDDRVARAVQAAGYEAALTMSDEDEKFAGESESLLGIARFGQSKLEELADQVWGGPPLTLFSRDINFTAPIHRQDVTIDEIPLILISGGQPKTIHADSRYQVPDILAKTEAIAAVDGGFFSLEYLDSNVMIGPVLSHNQGQFIPGNPSEIQKLRGRPLVLISPQSVQFIPFDPDRHNHLEGIQAELPQVTDAFVGAAFLVQDSQPQPPERFGNLFDFNAERHRAFWGINQSGQPTIGVSTEPVGSVHLGQILAKAGLRDAVMLDSGASTSLAFEGESLVGYTPRPVPHVVALWSPDSVASKACRNVTSSSPDRWWQG